MPQQNVQNVKQEVEFILEETEPKNPLVEFLVKGYTIQEIIEFGEAWMEIVHMLGNEDPWFQICNGSMTFVYESFDKNHADFSEYDGKQVSFCFAFDDTER